MGKHVENWLDLFLNNASFGDIAAIFGVMGSVALFVKYALLKWLDSRIDRRALRLKAIERKVSALQKQVEQFATTAAAVTRIHSDIEIEKKKIVDLQATTNRISLDSEPNRDRIEEHKTYIHQLRQRLKSTTQALLTAANNIATENVDID